MKRIFLVLFIIFLALICYGISGFNKIFYETMNQSAILIENGDYKEAEEILTKAINQFRTFERFNLQKFNVSFINERLAELYYQKSLASYLNGKVEESKEYFSKADELAKNNPKLQADIRYNMTHDLLIRNDIMGAIERYKEILRLNPNDWMAKNNLEILLRGGNLGALGGYGFGLSELEDSQNAGSLSDKILDLPQKPSFQDIPTGRRQIKK